MSGGDNVVAAAHPRESAARAVRSRRRRFSA